MVLADGCFDPLHVGHIRYLRAARTFGWPVVVRVAPDADIHAKGRKPFQSVDERLELVHALDMIDRVVSPSGSLADAIRELHPTILVKGCDWKDRLPDDVLAACHDTGTTIVFTQTESRPSSLRLTA